MNEANTPINSTDTCFSVFCSCNFTLANRSVLSDLPELGEAAAAEPSTGAAGSM